MYATDHIEGLRVVLIRTVFPHMIDRRVALLLMLLASVAASQKRRTLAVPRDFETVGAALEEAVSLAEQHGLGVIVCRRIKIPQHMIDPSAPIRHQSQRR